MRRALVQFVLGGFAMLPPLKSISDITETDLFAASYVKLARAQKFIEDLEAELARYIASDPLSAWLEHEATPPAVGVQWLGIGLLPGAIIGDAVHNLRTSLDLMASELARINNKSDRDVYFPFAASAEKFEHAIKSRNFDRAGEDAVTLLRSFAPYRGGNELLRALHDLDVQDKHTALVPTGTFMSIEVRGEYNIEDLKQNEMSIIGHDIQYVFPDIGILAKKKIIETLKDITKLVHSIIEAFANLVRLRVPSA